MSRITTPTFRVEVEVAGVRTEIIGMRTQYWTPAAWKSKLYGRPSAATLARWARVTEGSTHPGMCNEHLGITKVLSARIIRQDTQAVVAEYVRPVDFKLY